MQPLFRQRWQECWQQQAASRLRCLRDSWVDQSVVILGCGPSLVKVSRETLQRQSENSLVLCLKQAFLWCPELCDVHLVSRYKYTAYDYSVCRPLIIGSSQPEKPFQPAECDLLLPLVGGSRDFKQSLAIQGNIDHWTLGRRLERCCGPGILFELGFFVAEYLGVNRVTTLGVDFTREPHFYAQEQSAEQLHGSLLEYDTTIRGIPLFAAWLQQRDIRWEYVETGVDTPLANHVASVQWA